ncbi:MAG: pyridoxal phosphate-dependent aminotransferase [Oscillospiraceae bacterium]|nr:pyridoxal phosphate-dependent aminotransferase [Oscillospiraceae bacterium]
MERFDHSFFDAPQDRRFTDSLKYGTPPPGAPADVIPMWVADMDFPTPPAVTAALRAAGERNIFGYTAVEPGHWDTVAAWYRRRMGWEIDKSWFSPVPSVLSGVSAAVRAFAAPGEGVALCQPVYYPFARIITGCGRSLRVAPLRLEGTRYTFDYDAIEKELRRKDCKVFLLCNPHNPVARVWTREELAKLGEICLRNDVVIVSDEIHADLIHAPYRHTPMASVSPEIARITVTAMAPTKTFNMAGIPAAHLIIPSEELRGKVRDMCWASGLAGWGVASMLAARAAYGESEPWLEGLLDYLRGNIALLYEAFPAGSPIACLPVEGTYLAWLDCRGLGLTEEELHDLFLKKAGVWLDDGSMFGTGGEGFMRLNFACQRATLTEAIRRVKDAAGLN